MTRAVASEAKKMELDAILQHSANATRQAIASSISHEQNRSPARRALAARLAHLTSSKAAIHVLGLDASSTTRRHMDPSRRDTITHKAVFCSVSISSSFRLSL
jgi:hypothetical protein